MFKGEIIAVGTELLLGQIANTNAQYISKKMAEIGVPIFYHHTVGDNSDRLKEVILQAKKRSNLIIFTGGLGPTQDDLTKEAAAETMNRKLILDEVSFNKIKAFFQQRNIFMTDNNKKQAMVIEGSTIFPNLQGLAVGIGLNVDRVHYVFLPGPPREMKPMLDQYVIPWIKKHYSGFTFFSKVMRFTGIGEAALEEQIIDIINKQDNPTIAPLANNGEVTIRLTAKAEDEAKALSLIHPIEKEIHQRLEDYHFANGEDNIEQIVFDTLKERKLTISASESITGGLIGTRFTSISGSSSIYRGGIICYSNDIKHRVLQVPQNVLNTKGAVSFETAKALAENTLQLFQTDIAISVTGIAGPEAVEEKPIGLVYIGLSEVGKQTVVKELHLSGSRDFIQSRAAKIAFYYLWKKLNERCKETNESFF